VPVNGLPQGRPYAYRGGVRPTSRLTTNQVQVLTLLRARGNDNKQGQSLSVFLYLFGELAPRLQAEAQH
jgi:hypothetical protein